MSLARLTRMGALGLVDWLAQSASRKEEVLTLERLGEIASCQEDFREPCNKKTWLIEWLSFLDEVISTNKGKCKRRIEQRKKNVKKMLGKFQLKNRIKIKKRSRQKLLMAPPGEALKTLLEVLTWGKETRKKKSKKQEDGMRSWRTRTNLLEMVF